ncbi:hypothetical protein BDP27DRAFT_1327728 [Rhodocollybia butyracea]|uniref:Aminoglycoside phosphotransferase domain-containing protein n=1 Tax=Rhodocollybia butyracea TaxID=206335 RepID=A0A9P5PQH3_9AGAR|nr:hypothetical protein BDP27DRAFT_1327728 [Rhodocollybia butyracea]
MVEAQGETLGKLLKGQPTSGVESLLNQWIPKIAAEAARVANAYGIYHGDLHDGNIVIETETGRVTLIDWAYYFIRGQPGFEDDVTVIQKSLKLDLEILWLGI